MITTLAKRIVLLNGRHSGCLGKKVAIRAPLVYWRWKRPISDDWSAVSEIYFGDGSVVAWKY